MLPSRHEIIKTSALAMLTLALFLLVAIGSWRNPDPAPPATPHAGLKIQINQASSADLELLPEIGPATADAILRHREQNGPFRNATDLDRVKGIGPVTLEKILPYISFE